MVCYFVLVDMALDFTSGLDSLNPHIDSAAAFPAAKTGNIRKQAKLSEFSDMPNPHQASLSIKELR
jgi:hypothetical protein